MALENFEGDSLESASQILDVGATVNVPSISAMVPSIAPNPAPVMDTPTAPLPQASVLPPFNKDFWGTLLLGAVVGMILNR